MKEFETFEEFLEYTSKHNFIGFDSEFTFNTRELVKRFGAKGVHMNKHWALRNFDWQCPCCNRSKSEIVRVNRHGDLSCQLVEHHDHTPDIAKQLFIDVSSSKTIVVADKISKLFVKKISTAFESYPRTVVCVDCNNADTKAKKAANAHGWFSFSPQDIEAMIEVSENCEHTVNIQKAIEIWNLKQDTFYRRINLINEFIQIAANKDDWYEPGKIFYKDFSDVIKIPFKIRSWLYTTKKYSENSINNRNEWRTKPKKKISKVPNKQEIEFAKNTSNYPYNSILDDWNCPICDRSLHEAFQLSNSKKWGTKLHSATFYDGYETSICNECMETLRAVKNELYGNRRSAPSMITIVEAKSFILSEAYNSHSINNQALDELLDRFESRLINEEDESFD